jgi:glycosyltransferase involved in cell wall biosynthesis
MNICIINALYSPYHRGGAEVVVERVVRELAKEGHRVSVITLGERTVIQHQGSVTIYRIVSPNLFSFININSKPTWLRLVWHVIDVFNIFSAHKVKKIIEKENPDVILTHNLKGLGYLISRVIIKSGKKHIHTIHDVQLSRPSGLILFGQEKPFVILDKAYEKICRWLFGSPSIVVSPSNWLMDYYRRRGFFAKSVCKILPNPVPFQKVRKSTEVLEARQQVNFLYVGQLHKSKGILFLIKAIKSLPENLKWHLTIVGGGIAEEDARQLINNDDRFTMKGRVSAWEVIEHYRKSDVTIIPSLCYENSPSVIYESLAANVPVIASDIGGIGEIVKDDYNGFTFAPADQENLQEVLTHFINNPQIIDRLKKNCFISVRQFSTKKYTEQLLNLLRT